ncbi:ABC transporter permease [Streptomyces harbinensis]|uniref:ABC-2 type transport system permease protein n=1 Tax=Streptomyces harbinensis TaxID=1176198 RepID=A0A1I6SQE7_9ACTN|nr:ABC transporter permease [Streptomyces harbinensis]SFS79225.1 ABC-2 type transport system permease protein [Streptomyces harbinensis]
MTATTAAAPGTAPPPPPRTTAPGPVGPFTGTGVLLRFALRRDRVRLPVWIAALTLGTASSLASFESTYADAADRRSIGETLNSPAGLAMTGPARYLEGDYGFGAMLGHQVLGFVLVLVALMSVLTVVRHTRAEEESGRAELLRAGVLGRHAGLAAALALAALANLALGALVAATVAGEGGGALLYGATHTATGVVFAALAAVAVQITPYARGAAGLGLAAIGTAYALRAVGDVGGGTLSWLSPIGWAQGTYVFAADRWWPLLLSAALAAGAGWAAFALSVRRDVGAGLRAQRLGRPGGSAALGRPLGFALRLHRGVLLAFAGGLALLGAMYGSILGDAERMIEDVEALREQVERAGGASVAESFVSVVLIVPAIVAAVYVVMAALRPHAEESAGRAEPVLSTALSRTRWAGSHLAVALAGGTAVLLSGGLVLGLTGALSTSDGALLWKVPGAALAYAPALWVTAGIAAVLYGWLPRACAAAWIVPAYAFVCGYLGELLGFPGVLNDLSPFGHVPRLPATALDGGGWLALGLLTALAGALLWLGLAGFRRRDLETK